MSRRKPSKPPKAPSSGVEFGATLEDTVVPDGLVKMYGKLRPVRGKLDRMYGEGNWGETELRAYVRKREWEKHVRYEQWRAAQEAEERPTRAATAVDEDAEVDAFMRQFPDLTGAHLPDVRTLITLQRSISVLGPQLEQSVAVGDHDTARSIQQTMTSMQAEVRQLHRLLRTDVGSLRGEGPEELRQQIMTVMDRAQALLQKHAIRLVCPACAQSTQERVINLGFLLFHFRKDVPWHLYLICPHPKCGQGIHFTGGPGQELQVYNGPEHIRPPER